MKEVMDAASEHAFPPGWVVNETRGEVWISPFGSTRVQTVYSGTGWERDHKTHLFLPTAPISPVKDP